MAESSLDIIEQIQERFYSSSSFRNFYTPKFRLTQLKKALTNKRTSAGERLQIIKYLDAHMGEVPEKGTDSGVMTIRCIGFGSESDE